MPELNADTDADKLIAAIDDETSAVVVQYPDILGRITDLAPIAEAAHAKGALLIAVVTEPVALGLIRSPGEMGADIVVGEGQSIGVGLQFGGPYVGLFATREKFVRQMPGRLAGETVDAEGKRGFVLTLSTREQHIRREKATSNICTNSGLCALAFSVHMSLLGEKGLRQLAQLNHARACEVADRLSAIPGVRLVNDSFFNEFTIELPVEARPAVRDMADKGILGGVSLGRLYPGADAAAERAGRCGHRNRDRRGYRRPGSGPEGGVPVTVNPSGWRPSTPANAAGRGADRDGQPGSDARGALAVRDRLDRPDRRRLPGVQAKFEPPRRAWSATARSALRASASRKPFATTRGCRGRITRSTSASSRSGRAR